jgi:leukotriene-A4 hydrolase
MTALETDPTTQANYWQVSTENVAFEWHVDFDTNTISGTATHTLRIKEDEPQEVVYEV